MGLSGLRAGQLTIRGDRLYHPLRSIQGKSSTNEKILATLKNCSIANVRSDNEHVGPNRQLLALHC